jgi:lipid II:glycine glycyltransferase (peptidoglycan interpeptide bridge formation enzyme)
MTSLRSSHRRSPGDPASASVALNQHAWDDLLLTHGCSLMQSWRWGEFMRQEGWRVERICVSNTRGLGMAQVLFRPHGPMSTAYIVRGPLIVGDQEAIAADLMRAVDQASRRHRAIHLAVEAAAASPLTETPEKFGFVTRTTRYSPGRTVVVPLLDDEALLAQMTSDGRYDVRYAQRHGVEIRRVTADEAAIRRFHAMLRETAERQGFRINPPAYYLSPLLLLGDDTDFLMASVGGTDVASAIAARFGDQAMYLFGASSTDQPVRGATALLQFEAMRWARDRGSKYYDVGAIDRDYVAVDSNSVDRSPTHDCAQGDGNCRFKVKFGGKVLILPWRIERDYYPLVGRLREGAKALRAAVRRP